MLKMYSSLMHFPRYAKNTNFIFLYFFCVFIRLKLFFHKITIGKETSGETSVTKHLHFTLRYTLIIENSQCLTHFTTIIQIINTYRAKRDACSAETLVYFILLIFFEFSKIQQINSRFNFTFLHFMRVPIVIFKIIM